MFDNDLKTLKNTLNNLNREFSDYKQKAALREKELIESIKTQRVAYEDQIRLMEIDKENEIRALTNEHEDKIIKADRVNDKLKSENEALKRSRDAEIATMVAEETLEQTKEIMLLSSENAAYKKEIEVMRSAFENMGFDVKDTKEVLMKLVDGISQKNSINVIKS